MRDATLVFLIKKSEQGISEICLAMKKRGFGINRWNGVGGKVNEGEEKAMLFKIRKLKSWRSYKCCLKIKNWR